jgi:hypothetical protein
MIAATVMLVLLAAPTPAPRPGGRDYLRAIVTGDFEGARAALDERLKNGNQIALPVGREKSGGVDQWMLVITPSAVALTQYMGKLNADASMTEVAVEDVGEARPTADNSDHSHGFFVRLKLKGKKFNVYFWPPEGDSCHESPRLLSFNTFLQCGEEGAKRQEFVARYVADALERLGASVKKKK